MRPCLVECERSLEKICCFLGSVGMLEALGKHLVVYFAVVPQGIVALSLDLPVS